MFKIPVYKPSIGDTERRNVIECMDSTWISSKGIFVNKFEKSFSVYTGIANCTSCSNGTTALQLALLATGLGPGDEIICPTFTYIASAASICHVGATPVFVDSDPDSWLMSVEALKAAITPNTKAVMCVHLYMGVANFDKIRSICDSYDLIMIEDCAESLGSTYNNIHVGTLADVATFSFFGNKTITTGEGGMVASSNPKIIEKIRKLKNQGLSENKEYYHDLLGYNFRMTNICAAIGSAQMESLEQILSKKRKIYDQYRKFLKKNNKLKFQKICDGVISSYWMISISFENSQTTLEVREHLRNNGIETRPMFTPMHLLPMFNSRSKFPNAENISKIGINLPSFPDLKESEIRFITDKINEHLL